MTSSVAWLLAVASLASPLSACVPDMASFWFGGCPNMTADSAAGYINDGRWFVVRSTATYFWPPTCTVVNVEYTNSTSSPLQLDYRYTRLGQTRTKTLELSPSEVNGTYYVQNSGLAAAFGRERLVVDVISSQLVTVLTCQPLLLGHVFSAQLWSRNATSPPPADVSAALQTLQQRGVRVRKIREVTQTDCPDNLDPR